MRTSHTHPLKIAQVKPAPELGMIGLTLCPGKKQLAAMTGSWDRNLGVDLMAFEDWNATAVVTLVEEHELHRLEVPQLGDEVLKRHMQWYHLPIRDRGVPGEPFEAAWTDTGERLRARVRSGFNVVVHCMGGLGRAGTIASRLLIELGWSPAEAVAEVRRVRPGALETADQVNYANRCAQVPEAQPATTPDAIQDRAVGALVGLAVGDALGTTLEFTARDAQSRLIDIVGGGPFRLKAGQWTDDTSMALALADSLLTNDSFNERDLMTRFTEWWRKGDYSSTESCFDIGMTVRSALARFERTGDPVAGSTDPMSAGNGSLMRLSPVAIRFWADQHARRDTASRQSRTTHAAAEAVDACILFADVLADAIAGRPRSEVLRKRSGAWAGNIGDIAGGSWRGKRRSDINSSGYVAHSLEAALWCVGRTGSFEEAVVLAANLGGDADTVAAITGQLAGAIYGLKGIPADWYALLHDRERIKNAAVTLFERSIA